MKTKGFAMKAYNWFLEPKKVVHQGGYLSDGYVVLSPHTDEVNRASAGIEKDGVYALYSAKKAVACDERPMPDTEGFLASLYEEKVKPYRGKNGHPVEWTPWQNDGLRYGVVDGRIVAANAKLVDRLLRAKRFVIHGGEAEAPLLILRKVGTYKIRQRVGILCPARVDATGAVEMAIIAEQQEQKRRQLDARLTMLQTARETVRAGCANAACV